MRGADGHFYVVKFQNNPQDSRVLVNEWLATRIAERIGLPVAWPEIVEVSDWLIRKTPELHIQLAGSRSACTPGLQFGSRYVIDPMDGHILDYMPESMLDAVHLRNFEVFAGALAFDKWLCNADGRQIVYSRVRHEKKYKVTLIDQGYCFNAAEWSFPDSPLRGAFNRNIVYAGITGWNGLQPWLSRIEEFDAAELGRFAEAVPPEWYAGEWDELDALLKKIAARRSRVRALIEDFRLSSRNPFPKWSESETSRAQRVM